MQHGLVAGALFLSALFSPATPATQSSQLPQANQMSAYRVEKGDTILSIANSVYGSEDYWTTILNDNDWIKDPNQIEKDWLIKVRTKNPSKPEELTSKVKENLKKNISASQENVASTDVEKTKEAPSSTTEPSTKPASVAGVPLTDGQLNFLGSCESGLNPARNSGNGFYGAFQFAMGTWNHLGTGYERADLAPLDVQKNAVQSLLSKSNIYSQFPGCAAKMRDAGVL